MSIRKKVTAALLLPVIALIFYSFTSSYRYYGVYSGMKQVKSMVGVSSSISRLVHELQKERGMTSGYVASNRTKFASELPAQREAVDTTEKQLKEYIGENSLPDDLKSRLKSTLAELEMRTDIRRKADTGGITAAESAAFYSGINEKLLSEVFKASAQTDNAAISRALAAYANFLTAKETAGIERAFLTSVLSEGRFTTDSYGRFSALSSRQSAYLTMFENTASAAVQAIFSQSVDNADYKNAIEMKQTLAGKADAESIGIDSEEWFKAATARINVLKAAEDRIAQSIDADASALLDSAFYSLCLNAAVAAGSMAALVALLYIIHTSIVGNITRLTKLTAELNSADADLTHRLNIKTGDELQELAENVNSFIAGISEIVAEVKHTASSLASSSSELAATADQLSGTLATQSGQVSDIASAMEEMNVTSRSIYNHIEEAQKLAEDAHSSTNTGSVRLRVAVDMVNGIRQSTDKLSCTIGRLNESSVRIGDIVIAISDIADQTNLLALNAAIEAARAGDAGRGFAVVADEVRKLAEKTQTATQEIVSIIKQLTDDAKSADSDMESAQVNVGKGVSAIQETDEIFTSIQSAVGSVKASNDFVGMSVGEQTDAIANSTDNTAGFSQGIQESAAAVAQISATVADLEQQAVGLNSLMERFKTS